MYDLNQNFSRFPGGYLFAAVRQKKEEFQRSHPERRRSFRGAIRMRM